MLNFIGLYPPQGWKRIPSNLGGQFAILGGKCCSIRYPDINVLAFISNLRPNNKPKMLKVGPKFSLPGLLV